MANQRLNIKGHYSFDITYQNMFTTHSLTVHYNNMLTSEGANFLIKKWLSEDGKISKIIVGKGTDENRKTYAIGDFEDPYIFKVDAFANGNQLVLSQQNIKGKELNNTTEIGVIGTVTVDEKDLLISRNRHTKINIPDSCIINLRYYFTLLSEEEDLVNKQ